MGGFARGVFELAFEPMAVLYVRSVRPVSTDRLKVAVPRRKCRGSCQSPTRKPGV